MKIKFNAKDSTYHQNDAELTYEEINQNVLDIWHTNNNDGFYGYNFEVEGTKEEIDIIKQFCNLINTTKVSEEERKKLVSSDKELRKRIEEEEEEEEEKNDKCISNVDSRDYHINSLSKKFIEEHKDKIDWNYVINLKK